MSQTQICRGVATYIRQDDGDTVVRYHRTDVVRFRAGRVVLSMGGWDTVTTRLRMNQASNQFGLGFRVYRDRGVTRVQFAGSSVEMPTTGALELVTVAE